MLAPERILHLRAQAPTRIDLAGGTLDLYPLYLFEDGGLTVNIAIDIMTEVQIEPHPAGVELSSVDRRQTLTAPSARDLPAGGPLDLLVRAVRFADPEPGLRIVTRSSAPAGSGLGASSSLLVCLLAALDRINGRRHTRGSLIELAAHLEAQSIRVPTGKQDYYAAVYGGVNAIWFEVARDRVEPLVVDAAMRRALEDRLVLSYTGEPHDSAVTNWSMMRAYIDGIERTATSLRRIKATALAMREALLAADLDRLGVLIGEEWENRRQLADGVSTPAIDTLIRAAGEAGAVASKVCGAGGGGCMVSFVRDGAKAAVAAALAAHGARVLPFHIAYRGVRSRALGDSPPSDGRI